MGNGGDPPTTSPCAADHVTLRYRTPQPGILAAMGDGGDPPNTDPCAAEHPNGAPAGGSDSADLSRTRTPALLNIPTGNPRGDGRWRRSAEHGPLQLNTPTRPASAGSASPRIGPNPDRSNKPRPGTHSQQAPPDPGRQTHNTPAFVERRRRGESEGPSGVERPPTSTGAQAPCGGPGTGPNPTDRDKRGRKWSLLCDRAGIPVRWATDGANRHDRTL